MHAKIGQWIEIKDENSIYEVTSGEIELYLIYSPESGNSRRIFLLEVKAGGYFCGIPENTSSELVIAAMAVEETVLTPVSRASISLYTVERKEIFLTSLLEILFCRSYRTLPPKTRKVIRAGETAEFPAGTNITVPADEACSWLQMPEDAVSENIHRHFYKEKNILLLAPWVAVTLQKDASVKSVPFREIFSLFDSEGIMNLLYTEVGFFCRDYLEHFQEEERKAGINLTEFSNTRELLLTNSYSELFKNLMPELPFFKRIEDKKQPAAVHVIREIGAYYGLPRSHFRLSEDMLGLTEPKDILKAMGCSEIFAREVELPSDWYKQDMGPFLGFYGGSPVALIPDAPGVYKCIDPVGNKSFCVDEEHAEAFSKRGYSFSQAIPEDIDSIWKWVKWTARLSWPQDCWRLLFCCFIAGLIPVVVPLVTQSIFENIIPSYDKNALLLVVQVMFVASVSGALVSLVRGLTIMRMKNHIRIIAEPALWIKLLSLPAEFFRRYQVGDLTMRMQGISILSQQITDVAAGGVFNGIFCVWNLIIMFYYSYQMTFLALFIWGFFLILYMVISWYQVKYKRQQTEAAGKVSGGLFQILVGLNKFRLRAAEERAFYLWARRFAEMWKWNRKSRWQDIWLGMISSSLSIVLYFCIFYYSITLFDKSIATGDHFMTMAEFLCFNAAMGGFGSALDGLCSGVTTLWGAAPSLERIQPILKAKSEVSRNKFPAHELSGEIEATKVFFRYKPDSPLVLKNVSFSIKPGSFVAIVGKSGSGKSTLLRVLIGLEKPESGAVLYDGIDLSSMDVSSVRRQIGVVMQHGQLLEGSIFSNIVGALPLTMDEAWEVARMVGLEEDIKELPMGMHTVVGEGGATFSGGQRQRLLIARSIAHRPRIVVFDEATSSLDNETQAIVSRTLEAMHATRIVVAQRLSTIVNADRIIVIDRGEIVEEGIYSELMARKGVFYEIAARQQT